MFCMFQCGIHPCMIWAISVASRIGYAQPITGQVTEVICPVIGQAQPELTPSKRRKTGPGEHVPGVPPSPDYAFIPCGSVDNSVWDITAVIVSLFLSCYVLPSYKACGYDIKKTRSPYPGIILCMRPANERRRYNVTLSLIGWTHSQNDPCLSYVNCASMIRNLLWLPHVLER